jgi:hypothetical protein
MKIEGLTIKKIRRGTKKEGEREGWETPFTVIELSDGSILYASRDGEGNEPGVIFGVDGKTKEPIALFAAGQ